MHLRRFSALLMAVGLLGSAVPVSAQSTPTVGGFYVMPGQSADAVWYVDPVGKQKVEIRSGITGLLELVARAPGVSDAEFAKVAPAASSAKSVLPDRVRSAGLLRQSGSLKVWYVVPGQTRKLYYDGSDASFAFLKSRAAKADAAGLAGFKAMPLVAFEPSRANAAHCDDEACFWSADAKMPVSFEADGGYQSEKWNTETRHAFTLIPFSRDNTYVLFARPVSSTSSIAPGYREELKAQGKSEAEIGVIASAPPTDLATVSRIVCDYRGRALGQAAIDVILGRTAPQAGDARDIRCEVNPGM